MGDDSSDNSDNSDSSNDDASDVTIFSGQEVSKGDPDGSDESKSDNANKE